MTKNVETSFAKLTGVTPTVTQDLNSQVTLAQEQLAEITERSAEAKTILDDVDSKIILVQNTSAQIVSDSTTALAATKAAIDERENTAITNIIAQATSSAQNAAANASAGVTNAGDQAIASINSIRDSAISSVNNTATSAIATVSGASAAVDSAKQQSLDAIATAEADALASVQGVVDTAVASKDAAGTSATSAETAKVAAEAAQSAAATSASNAAASASTASTKANDAVVAAGNASTSATNAANSATTATNKATEAGNSATAAANSAAQAATFDPALFLAKTGGTLTGALSITANVGPSLALSRTGTANVSLSFADGTNTKFLGINTSGALVVGTSADLGATGKPLAVTTENNFWPSSQTFPTGSNVWGSSGDADFSITTAAGNTAALRFMKDWKVRWSMSANNAAETGGGAGSNFAFMRYNDLGGYIDTPLQINRATGRIFAGNIEASSLTTTGTVSAGTLVSTGDMSAVNVNLSGTITAPTVAIATNFGSYMSSGNPVINFDPTDYLTYNRSTDTLSMFIGGSNRLSVSGSSLTSTGPVLLPATQSTTTNAAVHKSYVDTALAGRVADTGDTMTGELTVTADITTYRSATPNTGVLFMNQAKTRYLSWDGTNYQFGAAGLSVGGAISATNGVNAGSTYAITGYLTDAGTHYITLHQGNPNWGAVFAQAVHVPGNYIAYRIGMGTGATTKSWDFRGDGNAYSGGSWVAGSDARVKTDLAQLEDPLSKLAQLTGYTYTRVDLDNKRDAGLIAQDIRAVLPEAVVQDTTAPSTDPEGEGFLSVNYNGVTALLVESVKALRAELLGTKERLAALENGNV
ncbi:tail fiber domain-containing protein [Teichococcus vastitatis]|uniref:Tail fiber domain-containing protein n=1 Tax=Teichococcus vastitatis TaxID=2307076 RepID=A0ABS9WBL7_9PROT|nr:tail fiber domain-containing protein [Pseudoroseomonas vastitatis]